MSQKFAHGAVEVEVDMSRKRWIGTAGVSAVATAILIVLYFGVNESTFVRASTEILTVATVLLLIVAVVALFRDDSQGEATAPAAPQEQPQFDADAKREARIYQAGGNLRTGPRPDPQAGTNGAPTQTSGAERKTFRARAKGKSEVYQAGNNLDISGTKKEMDGPR